MKHREFLCLTAVATILASTSLARAEDWPPAEFAILMPHSVGGAQNRTTDAFAEVWSPYLEAAIAVVPMPGDSGRVGLAEIMNGPRDGTVIGSTNLGVSAISYTSEPPDWIWQDKIYFLGMMSVDPGVIAVREGSDYGSIQDVVDAARASEISIGIGAWASIENLFIQQMVSELDLKPIQITPFDGGVELVAALLDGEIDIILGKVSNIRDEDQAIRSLAVTFHENMVPDLTDGAPTFDSAFDVDMMAAGSFRAIFIPKELTATHPDRVVQLQETFNAAQQDPEFVELIERAGSDGRLVSKMRHGEIQAQIVQPIWEQYQSSGATLQGVETK